jgi:hypothetical protein
MAAHRRFQRPVDLAGRIYVALSACQFEGKEQDETYSPLRLTSPLTGPPIGKHRVERFIEHVRVDLRDADLVPGSG